MGTIISSTWMGHLGCGLAPREPECVLATAHGMIGKEIAQLSKNAPGTVKKRLVAEMFKLGVHRSTALIAETMRGQIISPLCIALAGLITMNAVIGDSDPSALTGVFQCGAPPGSNHSHRVIIDLVFMIRLCQMDLGYALNH